MPKMSFGGIGTVLYGYDKFLQLWKGVGGAAGGGQVKIFRFFREGGGRAKAGRVYTAEISRYGVGEELVDAF